MNWKWFVVGLIMGLLFMVFLNASHGGMLGELPKYVNQPQAIHAVNIETQGEQFSIFTFGCDRGYEKSFFHNVTKIEIEGCGVWFFHNGLRKYISGNFVIEPTPRPLGKSTSGPKR